uniref:HAD hydrolase, family IA n=1 Tax=Batrachochytrium dendrobatidis (strain JAM81 / FGSC 10211) TaxID=684364 RepID=F4PFX1_BATDJ|eukprot:XP_006683504.1 hypothetical protein BATDEDRAFT_93263 [Batrachochytrium dendrobatidis JAM81]
MRDKIDKVSKQDMLNMLEGIKYTEHIDEKKYKKHWSPISVPLTLHEGLNTYTKSVLDDIRKYLEIKNASSLKKAELSALLEEKIPDLMETFFLQLDYERFNLLLKIARNGGYIESPDLDSQQINYIRATGLVFTGTSNEKKILAVPVDLVESILSIGTNVSVRSTIKRNTNWVKLTRGLLYYYGTLHFTQLEEMVEEHTGQVVSNLDYIDVIHDAVSYRKDLQLNYDDYSNIRVIDPDKVMEEHQSRENVPYYPFTKNELLTAGEPEFVDRNESYLQFVNFITEQYDIDRKQAESYVEVCVYALKNDQSPNEILQYLGGVLELHSLETVQALMDQLVNLMNYTRKWILKGHTSMDLSPNSKQSMPDTKSNHSYGVGEKLLPELEKDMRAEVIQACCDLENGYLTTQGGILYENVERTLEILSKQYKLFIVSNCQDGYIEAFYKYHGLEKYFIDYENPGRTGLSKGENIKLVMERNQLENPVYVGDTVGDQQAAKQAGIPFIFATYGFGEATDYEYHIDRFDVLVDTINKIDVI